MDGVDADLVRGIQNRVVLRHQADRAFGGMIRGTIARTHDTVYRGQVDNAASTSLFHVGDRVLGAKEHPFHVNRHQTVPFLLCDLVRGPVCARDPGIIDQHVNSAEGLANLPQHLPHLILPAHIEMPKMGRTSRRIDVIGSSLAISIANVGDCDLGPLAS